MVAMPKPPVVHQPFLRTAELPALLHTLRGYGGIAQTRLGIRLLLSTGVRTGELRYLESIPLIPTSQMDLSQIL